MSTTDHLAKARECIAQGDAKYAEAAEHIATWLAEDATRTQGQAASELGIGEGQVYRLLRARREGSQVDWQSGSNKRDEVAQKVLRDPEQRRQALDGLDTAQIEEVIQEGHGVVMDRLHAKQAERDATPNARDLMGGEQFDPSESWADTSIIRVQEKAHALSRQVAKWGLVLGSLSEERAFEMVQEAERNIAEVRVTLQERIGDRSRAEA